MRRGGIPAVLLALALLPAPARAQTEVVVEGRVYDAVTNGPVPNAIVTLEGHDSVLSNEQGTFLFSGVLPGSYLIRVEAFGYDPFVGSLPVTEDVSVALPLRAAPLQLDSVLVEAETIDFDGRVRDPLRDYEVKDARVLTTQGHEQWSDARGHFDLDGVWAGAPLRLMIRSFGYLPLDTTLIPDTEERHDFDLRPDPVVEALIAGEHRRLEARAGDDLYQFRPALTRDDIADHTGTGTLQTMMEARYPLSVLRRVVCVVVDERQVEARNEVRFVLQNTLPENLERAELLELYVNRRHRLMLRVYTKAFFQRSIALEQPLQRPSMMLDAGGRYICR